MGQHNIVDPEALGLLCIVKAIGEFAPHCIPAVDINRALLDPKSGTDAFLLLLIWGYLSCYQFEALKQTSLSNCKGQKSEDCYDTSSLNPYICQCVQVKFYRMEHFQSAYLLLQYLLRVVTKTFFLWQMLSCVAFIPEDIILYSHCCWGIFNAPAGYQWWTSRLEE